MSFTTNSHQITENKIKFIRELEYVNQELKPDGFFKFLHYTIKSMDFTDGKAPEDILFQLRTGKAFTMIGEPIRDTQRVLTLWKKDKYDFFLIELEVPVEFLDYKKPLLTKIN